MNENSVLILIETKVLKAALITFDPALPQVEIR